MHHLFLNGGGSRYSVALLWCGGGRAFASEHVTAGKGGQVPSFGMVEWSGFALWRFPVVSEEGDDEHLWA